MGSALVSALLSHGHQVVPLVRSSPKPGEVHWDPAAGKIDSTGLERSEAVVHLAGDPIAKGRWTAEKKARIRDSRVKGTQLLARTLAGLNRRPPVLVSASAIGWYGNRGEEILKEGSPPGTGFLAETGQEWERATESAAQAGIRVVFMRFGIILSPKGGALPMMLPPFKIGLGGVLGSGLQTMSWISIDDVVGAILHAIKNENLRGPVNTVSPNPVTNREFTRTLGRVLLRPTLFPVPVFAVRLLFGEMGDEALLASTRVVPDRLLASGYRFVHPDLEGALRYLLSGNGPNR